ncbi:MAG: C1 family peptidase [Rikenellaceae bacterium]
MRHSVHIMFGKASAEALLNLKEYIAKFGEESSEPFFNAYLCAMTPEHATIISKAVIPPTESSTRKCYTAKFSADEKDMLNSTPDDLDRHLLNFFRSLYNSTIKIGNPGDFTSLHLCLHVPLYDSEAWTLAQKIVTTINEGSLSYDIDIIGFRADMAEIFINDDKQKRDLDIAALSQVANDTIKSIVAFRDANPGFISHLLVIQNTQNCGISLDLSLNSFIRIIGEFTLATIERYTDVFIPIYNDCDLQTFGLSMISLDKYYFVEYLLTNVYLYIMEREGITQTAVDINMAVSRSSPLLKRSKQIMSELYDKEVKPRLDRGTSQDDVITEVTPIIEQKFDEIGKILESFIADKKLSIPDKKAILATILGFDDELLVNTVFDKSRLILDDLDSETMDFFIEENNLLLDTEFSEYATISTDGEPVTNPLPEIKELRRLIQMSAGHIRNLQSENDRLEQQIAKQQIADKCLVKDGFFVIGGEKYRVLPDDDDDQGEALKEAYVPHEVRSKECDLRASFTEIKSQGQQGSCLAFATTSILEYMLKSNDDPNPDLSEAFLYYNARLKSDVNEDRGSRVDYAFDSLVEFGICTEDLCPYSDKVYNVKPSDQAYEEAKGRKVKKALLVNRSVEDIKSALEDGYPVGVSVALYESFSKNINGFVATPTQEEIEKSKSAKDGEYSHGRHAMVICGYSDKDKIFIVRNSWGNNFGDKGYCYMSYLYFENEVLFNHAWIVTEVSNYKVNQKALTKKFISSMNRNDAAVMYAINSNLIDFEKQFHQKLVEKLANLDVEYKVLKQNVRDPGKQELIDNGSQMRLSDQISKEQEAKVLIDSERSAALESFGKFTMKIGIYLGVSTLLLLIVAYVLYSLFNITLIPMILAGVAAVLVLFLVLFFPWRKNQKRILKEDFDERLAICAMRIDALCKEMNVKHLNMHIAGKVLKELFGINDSINNKYKTCSSFLLNLNTWYEEEKEIQRNMDSNTQPPFIPILSNDLLAKYYNANRDNITEGVKLWELLLAYDLSEEGIREFQKRLNHVIEDKIAEELKHFTLYSYISGGNKYDFLPPPTNVVTLLSDMDNKSDLFLRCNNDGGALNPSKTIMIHTSAEQIPSWTTTFRQAFALAPSSVDIVSTSKIVIIRVENLMLSQVMW